MGQAGIPMLNKVGQSMFWNSMWDNKINYTSNLSEDIFLKKFIPLIFGDNSSFKKLNLFNLDPSKLRIVKNKYKLHVTIVGMKKTSFNKYIKKLKKVEFYFSRAWILKYQRWVVIYLYVYIPKFSKLNKLNKSLLYPKFFNINLLYRNYNYASQKIKLSYSNAGAYKNAFVF